MIQESRKKWEARQLKHMQQVLLEKKGLKKDDLEKQREPILKLRQEKKRKKQKLRQTLKMQENIFEHTKSLFFPKHQPETRPISVPPLTEKIDEPITVEDTILEEEMMEMQRIDPNEEIIYHFMEIQAKVLANLQKHPFQYSFNWKNILKKRKTVRITMRDAESKKLNKLKRKVYEYELVNLKTLDNFGIFITILRNQIRISRFYINEIIRKKVLWTVYYVHIGFSSPILLNAHPTKRSFVMNPMIVILLGIVVATTAEQKTARVHLVANNVETRNVTGELILVQNGDNSIQITGQVRGLTEGLHGIHVHEKGDLRDGCTSTGPHFNPENVTHGGQHSPVRHVGDLGNIRANKNGEADVNVKDFIISFTGKNNIIGRAIVVHSGEDDLGKGNTALSASTGNSGDRWACGIVEAE